ncbi:MAG: hypothetical protein AAF849_15045 [Bacteroidota bacterium]
MEQQNLEDLLKGFRTKDGTAIEIPISGSLGLLAYGDIGLIAWRLKRQKADGKAQ